MASVYDLKPRFQALLRPLVRLLARIGISANQVTVAAIVLSAVCGAALARWPGERDWLFAVPGVLLARMALNAIDGMLAREHDMQSRLGAVLNELGDVIADAMLYLPFALHPSVDALPLVLIVLLSVISEMTGVVAIQIGASRRYDGPMGKSDRATVFGLLALILALGLVEGPLIGIALWIVVGLLVATIVNRARKALAEDAS